MREKVIAAFSPPARHRVSAPKSRRITDPTNSSGTTINTGRNSPAFSSSILPATSGTEIAAFAAALAARAVPSDVADRFAAKLSLNQKIGSPRISQEKKHQSAR